MVRLFVQEGEGQHVIQPRYPDPSVANRKLLGVVPTQSTVAAIGLTAFLAIAGRSQPGTFLKATAYISAANLSVKACQLYGEREVNRGVFKLDNIEPTPGKLWERTKHWTTDDTVVGGGLFGTFLAFNQRSFPGVSGWKRFMGAATVGCMVGGVLGDTLLPRSGPQQARGMIKLMHFANQRVAYARLKEDTKAQESLSRVGKLYLAVKMSPVAMLNPFNRVPQQGADAVAFDNDITAAQRRAEVQTAKSTLVHIEFTNGELKGPDLENGFRSYRDDPKDQDKPALQDWLERLQEARKATASEAQYIWHYLATKEKEFYGLAEEDREKDIVRREVQLLNNMAADFASRDAIFAYNIADAMKRLQQIEKTDTPGQNLLLTAQAMQEELPADWREHYSPHLVAEHIRTNWARQKELLGLLEQATSLHGDMQLEPGSPQEVQVKQMKQNAEDMKKNVEATERLLKDFEEQVRRAEERSGR